MPDNQPSPSKELDAHKRGDLSMHTYDINVYKEDGKLSCIYLDDYRIAGDKPKFLRDSLYGEYKVSLKDIIQAIPELREQAKQLTTTQQSLDIAVVALNVLAQTNRLGGVKMGSVAGFKETRLEYTKRIAKAALASMEK